MKRKKQKCVPDYGPDWPAVSSFDGRLLTEQAPPLPNASRSVQDMVIDDMQARKQVGMARYGTLLQVGNGRDMLRDAYEEALDLAVYLRGAIAERDST
jgi:hypothetical protein